ncbi:MAG TPA: nitroreductase family protein [Longilinea sp.]|nr:nitroreductase family protein [Longilinea sp.]
MDLKTEFTVPVQELIRERYSCRVYDKNPLTEEACRSLEGYLAAVPAGPFNHASRFILAAATPVDRASLRGLGTYGFIRNPPAFIIGACSDGPLSLEDFGYCLERIVLYATGLRLGTCWLGGTFSRSGFARRIDAAAGEILPSVLSVGNAAETSDGGKVVRSKRSRLDWSQLFFENEFSHPLSEMNAGAYALPLEMVRLAPSASNKQPWRILREGDCWHFFLRRTPGYRRDLLARLVGVEDIQRVDMGIAMCHFELAAREAGLEGVWQVRKPPVGAMDAVVEYTATWMSKS